MPDFRGIYRHAEEHTAAYVVALFALLAVFVGLQALLSPLAVLSIAIGLVFSLLTLYRPLWTLAFLALYLPFESVALKFVPEEIYVFARFFSEALIYLLVAVVAWKRLIGEAKRAQTPIGLPFALFTIVAISSAIINFVDPTVAVLGLRQILRFILVLFIVVYLAPSRGYIRNLTIALFAVLVFQSGLGIFQALVGESVDQFLLPSETRTFGDFVVTSGVVQFWDPGSRVFATFGRYDRLGTFLAFFLLLAAAFLYEKGWQKNRKELWWLLALGVPALVLTFSRSSWFGFLLGFLFMALWVKRDRRVLFATLASMAVIVGYLMYSELTVSSLTESPQQTVVERFFEAFSYERWRGEYYGLGRLYWIVQTLGVVVPAAPFFGFGPGQYGGGAVSALGNAKIYEQLGLRFGVYGTD